MAFKVGDGVRWRSPSWRGRANEHAGEVVSVLAPGDPAPPRFAAAPRNHESYLVRSNGRLYWPRVEALRHIGDPA